MKVARLTSRMVWAALLAACNAISGLDRDYVVDASTTTPGGDGGPGLDGAIVIGNDGAAGADAAPFDGGTVHCASPPANMVFCWDFENAALNTAPFGFTSFTTSGASTVLVDTLGGSPTGARALHATVVTGGASRSAVLWQTVATPDWTDGKTLTLAFSFRVKQAGTYAVIGAFQFDSREDGLAVFDTVCPAGAPCLDENDQQTRGRNSQGAITFDPARWYHAQVSLTRAGGGFAGKVLVDNALLDDRATGAMPAAVPTSAQLGVGAFYSGSNSGTTELYVDDVLATYP